MPDDANRIDDAVLQEICVRAGGVSPTQVREWIGRGWIDRGHIRQDAHAIAYVSARVLLIEETRADFGVDDASVDLVVRLIEQLRLQTRKLECLNAAIDAEDAVDGEALRRAAAAVFQARMGAGA